MHQGGRVALLLFALLAFWTTSRWFPRNEGPPVFFVYRHEPLQLAIADGTGRDKVHQFFDVLLPEAVNLVTEEVCGEALSPNPECLNGVRIRITQAGEVSFGGWLPASQRMALQIPLHPDRMSRQDWPALPGIGPSLAGAIEDSRQINGDFIELKSLKRVRGIGEKRVRKIKKFFLQGNLPK